jgi:hypothetical protein
MLRIRDRGLGRDRPWPSRATPLEKSHEALQVPPGHNGRRGGRARSASTACPRRSAPPQWMAVLAPMCVADTPAKGKAYSVRREEVARWLGRDEASA